jgi:hypothetical protein
MSTLHTTTNLRPYVMDTPTQLDGGDKIYLRQQLKNVQDAITALVLAAQQLEQRLVAGGL